MPQKYKKKLRKKWAIYSRRPLNGPYYIGKIIKKEKEVLTIEYNEYPITEFNPGPRFWRPESIISFYTSLKAINFFLDHHYDGDDCKSKQIYNLRKKYLVGSFLSDFPSEQKNLEKLLVKEKCPSRLPKCTFLNSVVKEALKRSQKGAFKPQRNAKHLKALENFFHKCKSHLKKGIEPDYHNKNL